MPDFIIYLSVLKKVSNLDLDNIILSIDLNGLEFANYKKVIESIINLKGLGIAVRLDLIVQLVIKFGKKLMLIILK